MVALLPRCARCRVTIEPGHVVLFRIDGRVVHPACPDVRCAVCSRSISPDCPIRRDGEQLIHGNCWLKRFRASARAS
jgi:LIM domain